MATAQTNENIVQPTTVEKSMATHTKRATVAVVIDESSSSDDDCCKPNTTLNAPNHRFPIDQYANQYRVCFIH